MIKFVALIRTWVFNLFAKFAQLFLDTSLRNCWIGQSREKHQHGSACKQQQNKQLEGARA